MVHYVFATAVHDVLLFISVYELRMELVYVWDFRLGISEDVARWGFNVFVFCYVEVIAGDDVVVVVVVKNTFR